MCVEQLFDIHQRHKVKYLRTMEQIPTDQKQHRKVHKGIVLIVILNIIPILMEM